MVTIRTDASLRTLLGPFGSGDDENIVGLDGPLTRNPSRQPTTVGEAVMVEIVIRDQRREYLMRKFLRVGSSFYTFSAVAEKKLRRR